MNWPHDTPQSPFSPDPSGRLSAPQYDATRTSSGQGSPEGVRVGHRRNDQYLDVDTGIFYVFNGLPGSRTGWNALVGTAGSSSLILANGTTTKRSLQERFGDVFNVKDFGATGNGVTDDAAAIQSCLDASSDGTTVVFSRGNYRIGTTLTVSKSILLVGSGWATITESTPLEPMILITADGARVERIVLAGAETSATWDSSLGTSRCGFRVNSSVDVEFFKCKVINKSTGYRLYLSDFCELKSCRFEGFMIEGLASANNGHGFHIGGTGSTSSNNCLIEGCFIRAAGNGITVGNRAKGTKIKSCDIRGSIDNGIYGSSAIGSTVEGCYLEDNLFNVGIKFRGMLNKIIGNTCKNGFSGIAVTGFGAAPDVGSPDEAYSAAEGHQYFGYGATVHGNTIETMKYHGIDVGVIDGGGDTTHIRHCSVVGNTIFDIGNLNTVSNPYAIRVWGNGHCIEGNRIYDVGLAEAAILIATTGASIFTGIHVRGNFLETTSIYGIDIQNGVMISLEGNTCKGQTQGLRIREGDQVIINGLLATGAIRFDGTPANKVIVSSSIADQCSVNAGDEPTLSSFIGNYFATGFTNPGTVGLALGNIGVTSGDWLNVGGRKHFYGTAAPVTGTWGRGDIVYNQNATAVGQYAGWYCITSGSPGTWQPFGVIA